MHHRLSILLAATCLTAGAGAAHAADASSTAAAAADNSVGELVVIGSRAPPRSRLDTTAPVDVVPTTTLQHNGSTELAQALSEALPSLNFPRPTLTDGTDSVRPATLRGLAPDQVLVLVNGKRRQTSALVNLNGSIGRGTASVDLNTIPTAALSTVEVLRDGASAMYGSDAIAGVINLRLREADHGGGLTVTFGGYDTDFHSTPQAAPAGATWNAPADRHINDGFTTTVSAWEGYKLGDNGFLTLSTEYKHQDHTVRAGPDERPQYAVLAGGVYDPRENSINRVTQWFGDPDLEQYTFFGNGGYDVGAVHLYGWASYQHRDTTSGGTFRRPCSATVYCYSNNTVGGASANSSIQDIAAIYPDGFLPKINPTVQDASAALGAKFKLGEWDADTSLVWGTSKIDYRVIDSLNATLGAASPSRFDAGGLQYSHLVGNADFTRQFHPAQLADPITLAAGLEYRYERYSIRAGELNSYTSGANPKLTGTKFDGSGSINVPYAAGAQVFPGFQPSNAGTNDRSSVAGYVDLDVHPLHQLDTDIAIRAEHYSDFGSVVTGKLAGRYDFSDMFAIRGAISNGFRAPALQQTSFTTTSTTFINGTPFQIATLPSTSPIAEAVGGKPLEPEKSVNYSIGGVFRYGRFSLTVDAYRINVNNRIVLSENLTQAGVIALLPSGSDISGLRFFINGVNTTTNGVDLVGTYKIPTENFGSFDLQAGVSHDVTLVTRKPNTPQLVTLLGAGAGDALFAYVNTSIYNNGQPQWKGSFEANWSYGMWGATTRVTYYGNVHVPNTNPAFDYWLGDHALVDMELRANLNSKLQVAVGANNLLDQYPRPAPNSTGGAYSSYSPFGFDGRFLYGRVSYNW
ncbi:TonB-dependent receptor plug domain-containing protein [Caulobacter sp. KR2-114]|uniref:TonB-dependent receptor plug domain-containing protein n=1 Tax=Caulobacter sp. KR2-114 TaxID=3400912 RepID=UPI003C01A798